MKLAKWEVWDIRNSLPQTYTMCGDIHFLSNLWQIKTSKFALSGSCDIKYCVGYAFKMPEDITSHSRQNLFRTFEMLFETNSESLREKFGHLRNLINVGWMDENNKFENYSTPSFKFHLPVLLSLCKERYINILLHKYWFSLHADTHTRNTSHPSPVWQINHRC